MAKIPIEISKIIKNKQNSFKGINEETLILVKIIEKGKNWLLAHECSIDELKKFRDEIDDLLVNLSIAEELGISSEHAAQLQKSYKKDELCKACDYQGTKRCIPCLFEIESPLERKLFLALSKSKIYFKMQYGIGHDGQWKYVKNRSYTDPENNFIEVLTIADFYIEKRDTKLCIYTDGHTYHRSEKQVQKDRKIDRKLQELGYKVLRFTGKDVNENIDKVIEDIKKWIK